MDTDIEIVEKEIGKVLEIEERAYVWQMPSVMSKNFTKLVEYTNTKCDESTQVSLYARYVGFDWEKELSKGILTNLICIFTNKWHFFTGITNTKSLDSNTDIKANIINKRKYIKTIHYGEYKNVSTTYKKMCDFAKEKAILIGDESFEFYLNDPKVVEKEKIEIMDHFIATNKEKFENKNLIIKGKLKK